MAQIRVNDIFDELIEENIEINKCLNILIKFKTFVDLVFNEMKTNLKSNHLQMYYDLNKEVLDVFKSNKKEFSFVDQNLSERKKQLFETLSSKPQNCDNNSLQTISETNDNSIDLMNVKDIKVKKISPKIKSKALFERHKQNLIKKRAIINDKNISFEKQLKPKKRQKSQREDKDINPMLCDVEGCQYRTTEKRRMESHINSHKGLKPYNCSLCDRNFSSYLGLWGHNSRIHPKENSIFKCQFEGCGKTFKNKVYLRNHSFFHSDTKFSCVWPGCDKAFRSKQALRIHTSRDHLEVRPFVCKAKNCSKSYTTSSELKIHMQSHSPDRKFKCLFEGCIKAFKSRHDLRLHSFLHSEVEISCDWPGCEYTTKIKYRLLKHRLIHTSERPFLCDWPECGKRFKHKKYLENHQRIHSSDKRYACNWPGCQYRCTDSGNLVKHRRVHIKN